MKRWSGLTFLLLAGAIALGVSSGSAVTDEGQEGETKGFWVENTTVDLGKIRAGEDAVGTFIFHNETDKDVKIIRAKPS